MNGSERLQPVPDAGVLYEMDIGPAVFQPQKKQAMRVHARPERNARKLQAPGAGKTSVTTDAPQKKRYDEGSTDEESYTSTFSLRLSGTYFDENDKSLKVEYRLLPEKAEKVGDAIQASLHDASHMETGMHEERMQPDAMQVPNSAHSVMKYAQDVLGAELSATYDSGVLNIEYKNAESINGQMTYQRIVFKAEHDGDTVYDLTIRKFSEAGIETRAEYDGEFGSMMFTSLNGRAEGTDGNFNEFYLNGEIGASSADKAKLKEGDTVEWRYAKETDGSCGGSPDFSSLQSALEYSAVAKAQAQYFGMLSGMLHPNPVSPETFSRGIILH